MKFLLIPLVIIVIAALVFGYFGYQGNYFVNIPLVIANITAISTLIIQIKSKKHTIKVFTGEP